MNHLTAGHNPAIPGNPLPEEKNTQDKYLFISSSDLIEFFLNNLGEKDIKTQTKRIFEMARVFLNKKSFSLEDVYSVFVMVKDIKDQDIINDVFKLYFKEGSYPVRVLVQISGLEKTADLEIEFSAFRGEKSFVNGSRGHLAAEPFSQGVVIEDFVHCSGVLPLHPLTHKLIHGDFKQQVRQCLDNLRAILEDGGSCLDKVYNIMVYLKDLEKLSQVKEIFAEYNLDKEDIMQEVIMIDQLNEEAEIEISCSARL